jgi:hypothetical protein
MRGDYIRGEGVSLLEVSSRERKGDVRRRIKLSRLILSFEPSKKKRESLSRLPLIIRVHLLDTVCH